MDSKNRQQMGIEDIPILPEEEQRLRDAGRKIVGKLSIHVRPSGDAKAHEFLIGQLVGQGAIVRNFCGELRKRFGERCDPMVDNGKEHEDFQWLQIKPDAFTITDDEVCIYEVDVTSPASMEKLDSYAHLWWELDDISVLCRLFVVDARGSMREIDLPARYFDEVLPAANEDCY
jgi:hypothetical protein